MDCLNVKPTGFSKQKYLNVNFWFDIGKKAAFFLVKLSELWLYLERPVDRFHISHNAPGAGANINDL